MAIEFKKTNKTCSVELLGEGEGGLAEIGQQLKQYPDRAIFGVIKVKFFDEMATKKGSPYVKFIYFRFLGTKVNVMTKGFLTPRLGSIDDVFPVKHLSYDIDENLTKFDQKTIANDFLRVSDNKVEASSFDFGPNQIYNSQPEKVVNTNKKPQPQVQPKAKTTQPKEKPKKVEPEPEPEPEVQPQNNDDYDAKENQQQEEQNNDNANNNDNNDDNNANDDANNNNNNSYGNEDVNDNNNNADEDNNENQNNQDED